MLSDEIKAAVIDYTVQYSKGLIETCPEVAAAYDAGKVTTRELEDFLDLCRLRLQSDLPEARRPFTFVG